MEGNKINSPPFPIPDVARQPHNDDDDYDGDGEEEKEEGVELIFYRTHVYKGLNLWVLVSTTVVFRLI